MKTYTPVYFIKKVLICLLILIPVSIFIMNLTVVRAREVVPDDGWPSRVIFDTIHVCYGGTIRWVAMGNPNLLQQTPPPSIARIMTVHCFCVLDKIRTEFKYSKYVDYIDKDSKIQPVLIPKLFMKKSLMCIREHDTLQGLILLDAESLKGFDKFVEDNETKIDRKLEANPPDSGKLDSPEQPKESIKKDLNLLSF
tara:strand:+ start:1212 stop:1799 length:588 start_codon:yes stop_codon:yes gene_type:complete